MIDPNELIEGEYYFLLVFYKAKIRIPKIRTYIYIGKNVYGKDKAPSDEWYFQDPQSYLKHGSFLTFTKEVEHDRFLVTEDMLPIIYDLSGLIEELDEFQKRK